uniref:Uncharacterized protein n=1 Tax=Arundo donax TaxID=35708 RepID=A0A0A9AAG6_ARUDO
MELAEWPNMCMIMSSCTCQACFYLWAECTFQDDISIFE